MMPMKIYNKTRKAIAHYMEMIRYIYFDDSTKPAIRHEIMYQNYEKAKAVLFFSLNLNCMSDDMYDDLFDRLSRYYEHYRKKIFDKQW